MAAVSVIIPAYNAALYIVDALESVFAQTHSDFEVIAIDDGSTDETWQILKRYADRICCLRQVNGGPARARNAALRLASGTFVAFLDADDLWVPEKLSMQAGFLEEHHDVELVFSDMEEFSEDEVVRPSFFATRQNAEILRRPGRIADAFERLLGEYLIPTSTVLVRRRVLDKVGTFDETFEAMAEDKDLWLRIARVGGIGCLPLLLTRKRVHASNVSRAWGSEPSLRAYIQVFTKIAGDWDSLGPKSRALVARNLGSLLLTLGNLHLSQGRRASARRDLATALRYRPSPRAILLWLASYLPSSAAGKLRLMKRRIRGCFKSDFHETTPS